LGTGRHEDLIRFRNDAYLKWGNIIRSREAREAARRAQRKIWLQQKAKEKDLEGRWYEVHQRQVARG